MTRPQFGKLRHEYLKDQKTRLAEFAIRSALFRCGGDPEIFSTLLPEVEAEVEAEWKTRLPHLGQSTESFVKGDYEAFLVAADESRE